MIELPELPPDPAGTCEVDCGPGANGSRFVRYEDGYSADQMTAYARQAVAEAMERAAQIADSYTKNHASATAHHFDKWIDAEKYHAARMDAGAQIRDAIRAEMSKETL